MWLASRSRAAPTVVVAAAWQHGPGSVRRPPTAHHRLAGLPVTQCRPWPAEDVWSEPRAAPVCSRAREKRAERFHAASSRPAIRAVLTTPGASGATHLSSSRIPYSPRTRAQREYERSTFSGFAEVVLGRTRPALRRQPHSPRGTARELRGVPLIRYLPTPKASRLRAG